LNALIDTNVILDDILNRTPYAESVRKISRLVSDEVINGYLTANCFTDIFYVVSKNRNEVYRYERQGLSERNWFNGSSYQPS
jgi:predicted nucleic acid-binding protein